jgi:hypothetical protein
MVQESKEVKIQIRASDANLSGTYANNMIVHMNHEEFVLDFINVVPPHATLNARVAISPGNLKRMMSILENTLKKYEEEYGKLPAPKAEMVPPTEFVQ